MARVIYLLLAAAWASPIYISPASPASEASDAVESALSWHLVWAPPSTGHTLVGYLESIEHRPIKISRIEFSYRAPATPTAVSFSLEEPKMARLSETRPEHSPLWYVIGKEAANAKEIVPFLAKFSQDAASMLLGVTLRLPDGIRLTAEPPSSSNLVSISDFTFSEQLDTVCLYLRTSVPASDIRAVVSVDKIGVLASSPKQLVYPGGLLLQWSLPFRLSEGQICAARVGIKDGTECVSWQRAFFPFGVECGLPHDSDFDAFGGGPQVDYPKGISPRAGIPGYDATAEFLSDNLKSSFQGKASIQCLAINQGGIATAAPGYGLLVDAIEVHPEPTDAAYLGRYSEADFHYTEAKTRFCKQAVEPRPLFVSCETAHRYGEIYKRAMLPEEIRLRVAYMMARGAKRLIWRLGYQGHESKEIADQIENEVRCINEELFLLKRFLGIGSYVELATTTEPLVEAATILGGERGLVVYLINHDRSFAWPKYERINTKPFWLDDKTDPFEVKVHIPTGLNVKDVYEVGGRWSVPKSRMEGDSLKFVVSSLHDARTFVIDFEGGSRSEDSNRNDLPDWDEIRNLRTLGTRTEASTKYPQENPDIQFEEKQWFFKTVDPLEKVLKHRYEFRNAGKSPLQIFGTDTVPANCDVELSEGGLRFGDRGFVEIAWKIPETEGKVDKEFWVRTNDPNESRIRLLFGGTVQKELDYYPERVSFSPSVPQPAETTLTVFDNRNGTLELSRVECSSRLVTWNLSRDVRKVVDSYAEIFGGTRTVQTFTIRLKCDLGKVREPTDAVLKIQTSSRYYPILSIPIHLEPLPPLQVSPQKLSFGLILPGETIIR